MDNVAIIQKIYMAFATQDVATILEHLSDEVDWGVAVAPKNGAELVPFYEPLKGKPNVTRFFVAFATEVEIHGFEPRAFFASGDKVAVWTFVDATVKRTGKRYSHEQMHLWDLAKGRVTRYRHYEDTAAVIACFSTMS